MSSCFEYFITKNLIIQFEFDLDVLLAAITFFYLQFLCRVDIVIAYGKTMWFSVSPVKEHVSSQRSAYVEYKLSK